MRHLIAYAMSFIVMGAVAYAFAPRNPSALPVTELHVARVQVNDLVSNGEQLVAVGERGSILLSNDNALTWQSAQVSPQRGVTLTGVVAIDQQQLLAVGHDSWVLRSDDGGKTWVEVHYDAELGEPLLGIWSAGSNKTYAFGSFGKFLESTDSGRTWTAREINSDGFHLNALEGLQQEQLMLVGEQGLVMRSTDAGASWQTLEPFYNGSLFGVARLAKDRWLAYGMRGHVFVSHDAGDSWQQVELAHANPLYGHVMLPDHTGVLLVGAGSSLVYLDLEGKLLRDTQQVGAGTLTSAIAPNRRTVLVGGERGVLQGEDSRLAAGH